MKEGLVSIVIPVYNGSDFVCEAVESALSQSYEAVEVVVVNDGSTDGGKTRNCLEPYMDRIVYLEKGNGGVATALNAGIKVMSGEFFAWLSHDDLFDKDKIKKQMEAMASKGDKASICAMNYVFFDDSTKEEIASNFQKYYPLNRIVNSIFLLLWGELHFSSLLFHRSHFDRVGLFNENLKTAQDNDFIFRLLRKQQITFIPDVGSYVRVHSLSGTSMHKDVVNVENARLYQSMLDALSEEEKACISGSAKLTEDKLRAIVRSMSPEEETILGIENAKKSNLVLVGAGGYGRRLNYELISMGIKPKMFLDNDPGKDGKIIEGTICKRLDKSNISSRDLLVITNKFPVGFEEQLESLGVKKYIKKAEIDISVFDGTISKFGMEKEIEVDK